MRAEPSAEISHPQHRDVEVWDMIWRRWQMEAERQSEAEWLLDGILKEFIAAAENGWLAVWGRPVGSGAYELIDRLFWATAYVDPLKSMKEDSAGGYASTKAGYKSGHRIFVGLRVRTQQIEAIWPGVTFFRARSLEDFLKAGTSILPA